MFLESEIDLLKFSFKQTNHVYYNNTSHSSKAYFIPKPQNLGIDSMGEFAVSFELSGQFLDEKGNPASLILISEALEEAFNFSFGDIYKSKKRIFSRKTFNLTKALDYLKNLLIRENRNKSKQQDEK